MRTARFETQPLSDPSWWHWAATIPLLAAMLAGVRVALPVAMVLCGAMAGYFWWQTRDARAMPVQVRLAYLLLLAIGALPGMAWLHATQLVGTTTMVLFGYCPLVRMLTLLPWNREVRITRAWLSKLIFAAAPGGIWNFTSPGPSFTPSCSCSLAGSSQATEIRAATAAPR